MSDLDVDVLAEDINEAETELGYGGSFGGRMGVNIIAAARRFLALTETGPDYGKAFDAAHHIIWIEMELEFSDHETMSLARRVVDAALADYLTEEVDVSFKSWWRNENYNREHMRRYRQEFPGDSDLPDELVAQTLKFEAFALAEALRDAWVELRKIPPFRWFTDV